MKTVLVKYQILNCEGREYGNKHIEWFDDMDQAKKWVANMKAKNGGYFEVIKIKNANYDNYLRMLELEKELKQLRKQF